MEALIEGCATCDHTATSRIMPPCRNCNHDHVGNGLSHWKPKPGLAHATLRGPRQALAKPEAKAEAPPKGGSTGYYKIPPGATDLQDLIEHKQMSFTRGNIFKATYRLGEKDEATEEYDLNKIIWFAQRRLAELRKAT